MIRETDPTLKRDHDAVNGIINGYCRSIGRHLRPRVTKLLHKFNTPIAQLGQWTSDQVTAHLGYARGPIWSVYKFAYGEWP